MVCHIEPHNRLRGGNNAMIRPPCKGFSLIELIIVIVVVSIAAVGMLALFGGVGRSLSINEDTQTAAQLGQECCEHILGARRNPKIGYSAINDASCDVLPAPLAGFARKVTVTDLTTSPPCTVSSAGTCKKVEVSITATTTNPTVFTFMIANY